MLSDILSNAIAGPFHDLRRFVLGALAPPPSTRRTAAAELAAARAELLAAGCDLAGCTEENLHTATVPLMPEAAYDRFATWQAWPRSGFSACPWANGSEALFSYRFWGLIPVVRMQLFSAIRPLRIIHRVLWGFGAGGYHCFLFEPAKDIRSTTVSIFTVYPPQPFLTGLRDQTNRDIFRLLQED
ncbi:MAG: hypothetical protein ACUVS6_02010 [Anaerolineae bacterium]